MHREIEVGGELTEDRLAEIAVRAFLLRNRLVSPAEALGSTEDGETPLLVEHQGSDTVILLAGGATIRTPTLDSVIWAAVDEATDEPATVRDLR